MTTKEQEIQEMIDRETRAWDTQDVDLLMTLWHPDMVWPWPRTPQSHDPMDWVMGWGRFNDDRWRSGWQRLFTTHTLVHNKRVTKKILLSPEGDGALAVVDIDTLWRDAEGKDSHWKGRVCKVFTYMGNEWKIIMHTGVLRY